VRLIKVFEITSNSVAFDEDESMVIIASCPERALEIAKENWVFRSGRNHDEFIINEVNISREQIVSVCHYGN